MKTLYLDQTGQLGGGEIALLPWLCHVRADAHVVLFEDGPFRALLEENGVPVEVLALNNLKQVRRESGALALLRTLPALLSLRRRIAVLAAGYDLLYANSQKAFLVAALAKRRGQPLVWHLRDILTAEHFSPVLRRVAVFFGNHYATRIVCNSQATADALIAAGGCRDKIVVVHDGVDAALFDDPALTPASLATLRAQIAPDGPVLVGLFGRLTPWKGQHILLEAIATLPNVHAVLVGDALFGEQVYVATLQARAAQPDLAGRVHFLGFRSDVPALMCAMDILAHTSTAAEPFGLVIVEAMLARRPVIATAAGGALEIVLPNQTGILVAPGSIHDLHSALQHLLANPAEAGRLAAAARARAEQRFSLAALFHGLSAALDSIASTRP
jgi:glycosyltransferase involved in cell wall biosynthesis